MEIGKNSRWDQTRPDATNRVVSSPLPAEPTMSQADFAGKPKTQAEKLAEANKLAALLRTRR